MPRSQRSRCAALVVCYISSVDITPLAHSTYHTLEPIRRVCRTLRTRRGERLPLVCVRAGSLHMIFTLLPSALNETRRRRPGRYERTRRRLTRRGYALSPRESYKGRVSVAGEEAPIRSRHLLPMDTDDGDVGDGMRVLPGRGGAVRCWQIASLVSVVPGCNCRPPRERCDVGRLGHSDALDLPRYTCRNRRLGPGACVIRARPDWGVGWLSTLIICCARLTLSVTLFYLEWSCGGFPRLRRADSFCI